MGIIVKTSGAKTLHTLGSGIVRVNSRNPNLLAQYPVTAVTCIYGSTEENKPDAHLEIGNWQKLPKGGT